MRQFTAVFIAALLLITSACGSSDTEKTPGKLVVGAIPNADSAAVHYALDQGLFKQAGIDVQIKDSAGGAGGIPALLSGDEDLDIGNYISLAQAKDSGLDLVAHPYLVQHPQGAFVLTSAKDSDIVSEADLKGKKVTVAINTLGNLVEVLVREAWRQAGLDWNDVKLVQIPFPEMLPALQRGDVNLAALPEPFLSFGKADGAHTVLDMVGEQEPFKGTLISAVPITTRAFAEDNKDTLETFFRVVKEASQTLDADPALARKTIASYTELPLKALENVTLPTYGPTYEPQRVQDFLDLAASTGVIGKVDAGEFAPGK